MFEEASSFNHNINTKVINPEELTNTPLGTRRV